VIAAGKVTTGEIADGAITSAKFHPAASAPNAATLDGIGPRGFMRAATKSTLDTSFFFADRTCMLPQSGSDPTETITIGPSPMLRQSRRWRAPSPPRRSLPFLRPRGATRESR
jgi:hypothetical protein